MQLESPGKRIIRFLQCVRRTPYIQCRRQQRLGLRFTYKLQIRLKGGAPQCLHNTPTIRCRRQRKPGPRFVRTRFSFLQEFSVRAQHVCCTVPQSAGTRFKVRCILDLICIQGPQCNHSAVRVQQNCYMVSQAAGTMFDVHSIPITFFIRYFSACAARCYTLPQAAVTRFEISSVLDLRYIQVPR